MVQIIENMTQATHMHTDQDSCMSCGGHGGKFLSMRRAPSRAGDAGETLKRRPRVECLYCDGTGRRQPVAPADR
jgi:hypothetical protein